MRQRILITGGSGLLALNWALDRRVSDEVILALHHRRVELGGVSSEIVDTSSLESIIQDFERINPDLVIHTAGLTSVEECESNPDLAYKINTQLAANVAQACSRLDISLVHISTDHIFKGDAEMAEEADHPSPLNVYGRTKAEAESEVLKACTGALVLRTNFYAWGPGYRSSFSDFIIKSLKAEKEIFLFDDVYYTPILAETLVHACHELLQNNASGIFHVVGDERISKYDFGLAIAREFELNPQKIQRSRMSANTALVRRPYDMSLSNNKLVTFVKKQMGGVDQQLKRLHEQEQTGFINEIIQL